MGYSPLFRGRTAAGTIAALESSFLNLSGGILYQYTPISIDTNGNAVPTDASSETLSLATIGVIKVAAINGQIGTAVTNGRILNISTVFDFGDTIYVDKIAGTLTNIKPTVGVNGFTSGDWVIRIGSILKNESNASNKDFYVNPIIVGQL